MHDEKNLRLYGLMLCMPELESLPLLQELADEHPWMQAGLHELNLTPLEEWQGEYTRLFVNGFPKTPAPPYESVYRHQSMQGPVVDTLHDLYQDAGLTIGEMPADYLGTQLEFAAHLAASDDPRAPHWQTRLWRDHLQHWLPHFIADVCQHSQLLIYRLWGGQLTLLSKHMQEVMTYA
ncbi:MAG: molecular chaperone TorD family protein [Candidatus Thiodiazotropha sp.]